MLYDSNCFYGHVSWILSEKLADETSRGARVVYATAV